MYDQAITSGQGNPQRYQESYLGQNTPFDEMNQHSLRGSNEAPLNLPNQFQEYSPQQILQQGSAGQLAHNAPQSTPGDARSQRFY